MSIPMEMKAMKRNLLYALAVFVLSLLMVSCGEGKEVSLHDLPSKYATLEDGTKVHYKTCGDGNITLMFVHGFGCDLYAWEEQYKGFCEDTIKMIFVDLPGFGESDKPETEYTLSYFADALRVVADSESVKRMVLVGHSLGTPICRQFVFDHPAYVSALCDIDGVYCFYPKNAVARASVEKQYQSFASSFAGESCQKNIESFVSNLNGPFTPHEVSDYAMSTMPNTPVHVASSTMANLIDPANWTGEKINVPSLIVCTRNSGIPKDNRQKMDELYNDETYMEFDNSGHFIMMEDAAIVNDLIERSYERWRKTEPEALR